MLYGYIYIYMISMAADTSTICYWIDEQDVSPSISEGCFTYIVCANGSNKTWIHSNI